MKERVAAIHNRVIQPVIQPVAARRSDDDEKALKAAMRDLWRQSRQEKETDPREQGKS